MSFCVNEFEVGVNDSIFSGNEKEKVYLEYELSNFELTKFGIGGKIVKYFLNSKTQLYFCLNWFI